MTDDEDTQFYYEASRLLPRGAHLIVCHSNELFDLFTLNAYTDRFFSKHFDASIRGLLTHPDDPKRNSFNIRENPLAYPTKLARYGFVVEQMEFMNFHSNPPLLTSDDPDDMSRTRLDTLSTPEADRWKLLFQCSMFGVRARKEA